MSNLILVDTDILIDSSRAVQDATDCLQQLRQQSALAICAITEMEMIVGCLNKTELQTLQHFLKRFSMIKVNEQISDLATALLI